MFQNAVRKNYKHENKSFFVRKCIIQDLVTNRVLTRSKHFFYQNKNYKQTQYRTRPWTGEVCVIKGKDSSQERGLDSKRI